MANLTPVSSFDNVRQIEPTDLVVDTIINEPHQQLTNRTEWLKANMPTFQQTPQGGRNTVLTGRSAFGIESVLGAVSINTMRLYASLDPLIFTASQGFDVRGEIVHTVQVSADIDLVMDAGSGTRYGVLIYNPTSSTVQFVTVQEVCVTGFVPGTAGTAIWYNPITGKTDYNDGSSWQTNVCAVIVGQWNIASGDIDANSIVTYPFRSLLYDDSIAPGTVISAPTTKPPRGGWLLCQGGNISRDYYARLFAAIGTAHGAGNGITTFGLPDYRGEFLRGNDNGRGIDASRVLGSAQSGLVGPHGHDIKVQYHGITVGGATTVATIDPTQTNVIPTENNAGTETRPRNVSTNFWIKF